jgi:hypothetical protein
MNQDIIANQFRHGKCSFDAEGILSVLPERSGALFEKLILSSEVGPEVVLVVTDLTDFAHEVFGHRPVELHLKSGAANTSAGPVLFLLWWMPPITNGKPTALYEQILNPAYPGTFNALKQLKSQTHLHVLLFGPGQELLDVLEFKNVFGFDRLATISERACEQFPGMNFNAAKEEYDRTYELMELFREDDPKPESMTDSEKTSDFDDQTSEDEFLIDEITRTLADNAIWLAGRLLVNGRCTPEQREALALALVGFARLPRTTPGLTIDFGFSAIHSAELMRCWSVHIDSTEIAWSAGGYMHGPAGGDSFSTSHVSLFTGSIAEASKGDVTAWLDMPGSYSDSVEFSATATSSEDFWERHVPRPTT